MSKFKPLAMVAADNPGAFLGTDEARAEGELAASDLEKVEQVLVASGYVTVPLDMVTSRLLGEAVDQVPGLGRLGGVRLHAVEH
ncbi:hypothetical protein ACFSUJ_13210 [Streptomyces lusitanus]|uniref:Uncharacterized protein n=1 Tax=Streptomyces lusitanus TaxID=68232 RepID=A0ABU3JPS3_9ACTN|nr:hypothetical protein [Streptomyces lusitanus]